MGGVYEECAGKMPVTIHGCHGYVIYEFAVGFGRNGVVCSQGERCRCRVLLAVVVACFGASLLHVSHYPTITLEHATSFFRCSALASNFCLSSSAWN